MKIARRTQRLTLTQSKYVLICLTKKNKVLILARITTVPLPFQDYEFQILTYRALQDPIASPLKKPKMECASDNIIEEVGFMPEKT